MGDVENLKPLLVACDACISAAISLEKVNQEQFDEC